jgi:hypothetical protein
VVVVEEDSEDVEVIVEGEDSEEVVEVGEGLTKDPQRGLCLWVTLPTPVKRIWWSNPASMMFHTSMLLFTWKTSNRFVCLVFRIKIFIRVIFRLERLMRFSELSKNIMFLSNCLMM